MIDDLAKRRKQKRAKQSAKRASSTPSGVFSLLSAPEDDLSKRRDSQVRRRAAQPIGAFGGLTGAALVAANRALMRVETAEDLRRIAAGEKQPTPERITMALDFRDLYGPEVDEALGGAEPMVDEWESGEQVPTYEQVQALAKLTDFPIRFFYLPPPPPLEGGFLCSADGCAPLG